MGTWIFEAHQAMKLRHKEFVSRRKEYPSVALTWELPWGWYHSAVITVVLLQPTTAAGGNCTCFLSSMLYWAAYTYTYPKLFHRWFDHTLLWICLFSTSFSEHALCPQRKESIFHQDKCGHARWLKAGIEIFSLKGEGTVIPAEKNLVTLQRAGAFSLDHSTAREGSPYVADVSSILDSSASAWPRSAGSRAA